MAAEASYNGITWIEFYSTNLSQRPILDEALRTVVWSEVTLTIDGIVQSDGGVDTVLEEMQKRLAVLDSRRVGDGTHLKLVLEGAGGAIRAGIAFGLGDRDPGPGSAIDCAFSAGISTWGGGRSVELHIRELARAPQ